VARRKPDELAPTRALILAISGRRRVVVYSYVVRPQIFHVIGPGEITFAGQGGMEVKEKKVWGLRPRKHPLTKINQGGRPSSKSLIWREALWRVRAGNYPETLKEFANELSNWLRRHHPEEPRMSSRVVEQKRIIRDLWHRRRRR
jgi:hypothetical protein